MCIFNDYQGQECVKIASSLNALGALLHLYATRMEVTQKLWLVTARELRLATTQMLPAKVKQTRRLPATQT